MNKLAQEIFDNELFQGSNHDAEAAATVALKWIEKCAHDLYTNGVNDGTLAMKTHNFNHIGSQKNYHAWLRENNLYSEPEIKDGFMEIGDQPEYEEGNNKPSDGIIASNGLTNQPNEVKI